MARVGLLAMCVSASLHADGGHDTDILRLPPASMLKAEAATFDCAQASSVARAWNEGILLAIRRERARPTIHARNLYHVSAAMYDAWAAFEPTASPIFHVEPTEATADLAQTRSQAISHAAYGVLVHRFSSSNGAAETLPALRACMLELGYDPDDTLTIGDSPAALGNRVAQTVIAHGLTDGANESGSYVDYTNYFSSNNPMLVELPGSGGLANPDGWQPLVPAGAFGIQSFLTPFWGQVSPFALTRPAPNQLYLDPGPPPRLGGPDDNLLKQSVLELIRASAWLDPENPHQIDLSPASRGNNSLGQDDGQGHPVNPVTGIGYGENLALRGDWARASAEFWADGPDTYTPPGHWNVIANAVMDHPGFQYSSGDSDSVLEWEVKLYLTLNGALHDAAIVAWETKRHYDSIRPISLVRAMAEFGQSTNPADSRYHPLGLPLEDGLIEMITVETSAPGARHAHLAEHVGQIAVFSWLGHPDSPEQDWGGTDWLLAVEWLPYQQSDFVTPPFPGYVSGHSAFSRAAAEVLADLTGSAWFPGGLSGYVISADGPGFSLDFEYGPSQPVELQWATYFDAADESGQSRILGGIHPDFDDFPGRVLGSEVGLNALIHARHLFGQPDTGDSAPIPVPGLHPLSALLLALLALPGALLKLGKRTRASG